MGIYSNYSLSKLRGIAKDLNVKYKGLEHEELRLAIVVKLKKLGLLNKNAK